MLDDKIYVDCNFTNEVNDSTEPARINFFQSRSQPILQDTTNYFLSIIRFQCNTSTLPVFIPVMKNGSSQETAYSITMAYNGKYYQQYMQFIPQNVGKADEERLFVYNFKHVIYLIHKCSKSCLQGLNAIVNTNTSVVPYITYNPSTQLCSIAYDPDFYGFNETDKINVYFNHSMYTLLSSFPIQYLASTIGNGCNYQLNFLLSDDGETITQELPSVGTWSPVSSVVFTTNLLPIHASAIPPTQLYKKNQLINSSSNDNSLQIITDFIGNDLICTPLILYSPSVYRYMDLRNGSVIKDIDLQVYWINKNTGRYHPLTLSSGGTCSVKILLSKKHTIN